MNTTNKKSSRYSPEVRERAVRMVLDQQHQYSSQWAAISSISEKIGCADPTLLNWVRQAGGPFKGARPRSVRCLAAHADPACLGRKLPALRHTQDLASAQARRHQGGPLHG